MKLRLSTDLSTGALFLALGGFAIIYGSRYAVGTTARMGPGYFPMLISSALVLVGRRAGRARAPHGWRCCRGLSAGGRWR